MEDVKSLPEWKNIIYKGYVNNAEISNLIAPYDVGILFLEDIDTFRDSLPVKIFDYAQEKLIIAWTGSVGAFYFKYVLNYPNIYLGQNFNDLNQSIKSSLKDNKISKSTFDEIQGDWFSIVKELY